MKDDRYEIKGKIGQGGIGAVYRAFDRRLNRDVAIKRVLPDGGFENQGEAVAHLLKEATSLSSVQHPHIVTVYDAGVDSEGPYVVMELLDGRTLDEMVERGSLTYEDFREVAIQTQEALIAAQDLNLVHRDLKPTNVMVIWLPSGKFQMKLVDFGLAKFSPKPSLQTIDHGDAVLGSIHYMAPEQFERTPLDQRSDMYSMGCMYYFALTGLAPFGGDSAAEVMASHLQHRVAPLQQHRPDLPGWLADWVMWHIEREMDNRPPSARESLHKFLMTEQSNSENQENPAPDAPKRPKLVFPGADPAQAAPATPVTPATPAATPQTETPPPAEVKTGTAPQPIVPPAPAEMPPAVEPAAPPTAPAQTAPAAPLRPATPAPPATPAQAPPPAPATPPAQPATPVQATPAQPAAPAPGQIKLTGPQPPAAGTAAATVTPAGAAPGSAHPGTTPASGPSTLISGSTDISHKGMSNAAKATIAAVLLVAVIIAAIVLIGKGSSNKEIQRFNDLVAQVEGAGVKDIPTTADDIKVLLRYSTSLKQMEQRQAIYQRLLVAESSDGTDLDDMIAEFACNEGNAMVPDIRVNLLKVVQGRKSPSSLEHLLKHAQRTGNTTTAAAALDAAARIATADDVPGLLGIIEFNDNLQVRQAAKKVIANLAERSDSRDKIAVDIQAAFERAATDQSRHLMIELLGSAGGDKASKIVAEALQSKEKKDRLSAIAALGAWADDSQFESFLDYIADEEDDNLRGIAFDTAFQFLQIERERDEFDEEDMWKLLAREAVSKVEKRKLVTGLANNTEDWAFAVVEFFAEDEDDDVSYQAERVLERMAEKRKNKDTRRDNAEEDDSAEEDDE